MLAGGRGTQEMRRKKLGKKSGVLEKGGGEGSRKRGRKEYKKIRVLPE